MANRDQGQSQRGQQVAVLAPPRMQMPAHVSEQYGLNEDTWRALTDAVFPLAKTVGAVLLALAYCERNRLDVFQRVVHIVPMRVGSRTVETVWPGIGQMRIVAQRQASFAGYDDVMFGEDRTTEFAGKKWKYEDGGDGRGQSRTAEEVKATVTHPEWAQFVVYKMLQGERQRLPGPRVYFEEVFASCSHFGGDVPNEKWQRSPRQMLEKCAEAAALRRAFPDVLGNEMAAEEMEGRRLDPSGSIDAEYVEVETGAAGGGGKGRPAAPRRADFAPAAEEGRPAAADDPAGESDPAIEGEAEFHEGRAADAATAEDGEREPGPLDGQGIPETDEHWTEFERLLEARVRGLPTRQAVDTEQEKQQFRLDVAPLKVQQRIYAMLADVSAEKPEAGDRGGEQ